MTKLLLLPVLTSWTRAALPLDLFDLKIFFLYTLFRRTVRLGLG